MTKLVTYRWLSFVDRLGQAVAVRLGVAIVPAGTSASGRLVVRGLSASQSPSAR